MRGVHQRAERMAWRGVVRWRAEVAHHQLCHAAWRRLCLQAVWHCRSRALSRSLHAWRLHSVDVRLHGVSARLLAHEHTRRADVYCRATALATGLAAFRAVLHTRRVCQLVRAAPAFGWIGDTVRYLNAWRRHARARTLLTVGAYACYRRRGRASLHTWRRRCTMGASQQRERERVARASAGYVHIVRALSSFQ
jgi:hypothetical protein